MLIGFIGIPASGKTTLAAEVFVRLKKMGIAAEFVVEVARQYIAALRHLGETDLVLTDEDQEKIMLKQLTTEEMMNTAQTITVSDSSPLNALMYMTPKARLDPIVTMLADASLMTYDLLVVCEADSNPSNMDPNRIHGVEARSGLTASRNELVDFITKTRPGLPIVLGHKDDWMERDGNLSTIIAYKLVDLFYKKSAE
jgi:nicotinamide riboside kinase